MSRDPLLAQIHIAKKEMGLEDEAYRDVLERICGSRSAADLSDKARRAVLTEFKRLGWKGNGRKPSTKPHVRKIYALWGELKRQGIWHEPDRSSLRAFVKKMTGVADPEWLDWRQATVVIEALKKMEARG